MLLLLLVPLGLCWGSSSCSRRSAGPPRWRARRPVHLSEPFGWKGPFFAADTGGAIVGNRIDFYDWRGGASQLRWGVRSVEVSDKPIVATGGGAPTPGPVEPIAQGPGSPQCDTAEGATLALPSVKGKVVLAPGAHRPGMPTQRQVLDFLARVAGIAGRTLIVTTGSNHSQYASSGNVSDHWVGMAADLGSVANGFPIDGGTRIAAAALRAAGVRNWRPGGSPARSGVWEHRRAPTDAARVMRRQIDERRITSSPPNTAQLSGLMNDLPVADRSAFAASARRAIQGSSDPPRKGLG